MVGQNYLDTSGSTRGDVLRLAISIGIPLAAGALGAIFTAESVSTWYQTIEKPWFTPPGWLFGPAWTALYVLMGLALFFVWRKNAGSAGGAMHERKFAPFAVFGAQLALNVLWSFIFFGLRSPQLAFVEIVVLLASIVLATVVFSKVSRLAALLLLPYAGWVTFASLLNLQVWLLNPA